MWCSFDVRVIEFAFVLLNLPSNVPVPFDIRASGPELLFTTQTFMAYMLKSHLNSLGFTKRICIESKNLIQTHLDFIIPSCVHCRLVCESSILTAKCYENLIDIARADIFAEVFALDQHVPQALSTVPQCQRQRAKHNEHVTRHF